MVTKPKRELTHETHERFNAIQRIIEDENLKGKVHPEFERGVKAASQMMWSIKDKPLDELLAWAARLRRPSSHPRLKSIMGRLDRGRDK